MVGLSEETTLESDGREAKGRVAAVAAASPCRGARKRSGVFQNLHTFFGNLPAATIRAETAGGVHQIPGVSADLGCLGADFGLPRCVDSDRLQHFRV